MESLIEQKLTNGVTPCEKKTTNKTNNIQTNKSKQHLQNKDVYMKLNYDFIYINIYKF